MATKNYHFILKTPLSEISSIRMMFHHNGQPFVYGTGLSIFTELWDNEQKRPIKDTKRIKEFQIAYKGNKHNNIKLELENINNRIHNLIVYSNEYISQCEKGNTALNVNEWRNYLNSKIGAKQKTLKKDHVPFLHDIINDFVTEVEANKKLIYLPVKDRGQPYSSGTIRSLTSFNKKFQDFTDTYGTYAITELNKDFEPNLTEYFNDEDYLPNTRGNFIKNLKTIINDYIRTIRVDVRDQEKKGLNPFITTNEIWHIEHDLKAIAKPSKDNVSIALYDEEITKLKELDLSSNSYYQRTLDVFLCGYYTSQRYSDYHRLSKDHIKGKRVEIITQKGKKSISLPLRKELLDILNKYPNELPHISAQEIGRNIKEICKMAKIDDMVEVTLKDQIIKVEKWTLVTTHTARRSGATWLSENGYSLSEIQLITGHSKLESLQKYIKPRPDRVQNNIRKLVG